MHTLESCHSLGSFWVKEGHTLFNIKLSHKVTAINNEFVLATPLSIALVKLLSSGLGALFSNNHYVLGGSLLSGPDIKKVKSEQT